MILEKEFLINDNERGEVDVPCNGAAKGQYWCEGGGLSMSSPMIPIKQGTQDGATAALKETWAHFTSNRFMRGKDGLGLGLLVFVAAHPGMLSKHLFSNLC